MLPLSPTGGWGDVPGAAAQMRQGVECRKNAGVVDEIPGAYKDLNDVIRRQEDLVEVIAHLKEVLCVKG